MRRLALLLSLALALPAALRAQDDIGIALGAKAPGAVVETLAGQPVNLASYVGKGPVLLEFWATWCGNCKALQPAMDRAAAKYKGRMRFVAVAVSVNQSPKLVQLWAARHKPPFEMLYDRTGAAADAYEAPATSYIVVLDRAGKVVYTGQGSEQDVEAAVKKGLEIRD